MRKIGQNIVSLITIGLLLTAPVLAANSPASEEAVFSEQELVNAVKPAVVRIVEHVEGSASIAPFKVDLKNFTIKTIPGEKSLTIPIKLDLTGSGFVVNPDGYILTNSHVVSDYTIKASVAEPVVDLILSLEERSLTKADIEKINKEKTSQEGFEFGREILEYVIGQSSFTIKKTVTVLNPTSTQTEAEKLTSDGFPAEVIHVNENWYVDDKDIAILKIEEKNLPSLRLGSSDDIVVGSPVYVFGFPSNAEFNRNSLLESTFTKGVVSAIKNSATNDFKIFQTDAKISTGSSGGPLFNEEGHVTGLVSFMTGSDAQENGDNFAFAIPIEVAKKPLSDDFVINDEGVFMPHFRAGIGFFHDKHCERAIEEFTLAKSVNAKFGVGKYVDPYIDTCNSLIASGLSIDSTWDEFAATVRSMGMLVWALAASGIFLIAIIAIGGLMVMRRLRKDKEELIHLEHVIEHTSEAPVEHKPEVVHSEPQLMTIVSAQATVPNGEESEITRKMTNPDLTRGTPTSSGPNLELLSYIKQARAAGLTFQQIEVELKNVGWTDDEISRALAVPQ